MEKTIVRARKINASDEIAEGDVLFDKCPNWPNVTKVTVLAVTKNRIVTEYLTYTRNGACIHDEWMRRRLYVEA
jgi:hypothetical protein